MKPSHDWPTWKIEECCDILDSKRVPINSEERERRIGNIPYYGANGQQGYIDDFIFDEPLILVAEDGGHFDEFSTRPIAYRIAGKIWVNNHAHVLRARYGFSQDAIFYALEHKDIQPFIVGGTRTKLNQSVLQSITIQLPERESEQTKIAEILSTVDQAIDQTEALIAKQQRIKTGLMQDLLTRGIDENGNLRSEEPHEFKDSQLGRIPVEWESGPLFERRLIGRPHLKTGPFGSSLKLEHWRPTGVPVITIGALGAGRLIESELLHVSESTAMRLQNYRLEVGDIVFSRVADVGRSAVISVDQHGWIMSSNLMCISLDLKQGNAYFLQAQLSYESRIRQQILSSVNAGGRDVANTEILNSLQFLWPPLMEQTRIIDCLEALDNRTNCAVKELDKLCQVKTALMQDLLTGKVSVAPLGDYLLDED